jgi:ABC-type multidrug transport system permease subunit
LAEPLLGNPHAAWRFVAGAAAVGATLLGSALYRTEQQAGTLELMWLACGSERALLWLRLVGALVALAVVLVPATMVLSWFLAGTFPMGYALMHGMMLGFFVLSTVGLAGTWLPQAWASAVMMGALFGAIFLTVGTEPSILNPFLDPWSDQVRQSSLTTARVLQLGLGLILLRSTAARLRKAL